MYNSQKQITLRLFPLKMGDVQVLPEGMSLLLGIQ